MGPGRLWWSTVYAVPKVSGTELLADGPHEEGTPGCAVCGDEPRDIFENDSVAESGAPREGKSGISSAFGTGRFSGTGANDAEVGENAAAAERFEPDRGVGDGENATGVAGGTYLVAAAVAGGMA